MKKKTYRAYNIRACQWYAGEKNPGGIYYCRHWFAPNAREARRSFLASSGWLHDEKIVKLTCTIIGEGL